MIEEEPDSNQGQEMAELLDSMEPIKPVRRGDVVEGTVMRADSDGIFVNIGQKAEGHVPPGEMRTLESDEAEAPSVGDSVLTMVVRPETADQPAVLSIDRAVGEQGWRFLEKALQNGDVIEGNITGFNRGGSIVEVEGVQGFVPMSQLVSVSREHFRMYQEGEGEADPEVAEARKEAQAKDIGKSLRMKVLEVNRGRNRAIFSERQAVQEMRDELKAKLIEELTEGETRMGKVTGISSFGAFVDLGGADGLIHISELSWNLVNSPEEIVKVGQELDVYVLRVDAENRKIALSLRMLQPEPWETIHDRHIVGEIVVATVTKLTNFGAFARVADSVEGLIHISELSARMITHPREVVGEGDSLRVKILRIEPERRRLGLSLKQAQEEEEDYGDPEAVQTTEDESVDATEPESEAEDVAVAVAEPEAVAEAETVDVTESGAESETEKEPVGVAEPEEAEAENVAVAVAEPEAVAEDVAVAVAEPEAVAEDESDDATGPEAVAEEEPVAVVEPEEAVAEDEAVAVAEPEEVVAEVEAVDPGTDEAAPEEEKND